MNSVNTVHSGPAHPEGLGARRLQVADRPSAWLKEKKLDDGELRCPALRSRFQVMLPQ